MAIWLNVLLKRDVKLSHDYVLYTYMAIWLNVFHTRILSVFGTGSVTCWGVCRGSSGFLQANFGGGGREEQTNVSKNGGGREEGGGHSLEL